jgi:hypothetical protein
MHTFPLPPGGNRRGQGTLFFKYISFRIRTSYSCLNEGTSSPRRKKGTGTNGAQQSNAQSSLVEPKSESNRCEMNNVGSLGQPQQHYQDFPNGKPPTTTSSAGLLELFTCGECSATFVSENDLTIHTKTHKPQPYKCSECSRA